MNQSLNVKRFCNLKVKPLAETKIFSTLLVASFPRHLVASKTVRKKLFSEGSVTVEHYGNYKSYPKTVTGGSVTGAAEAMSPVQLTDRFQPLLLTNGADDGCSSQSRLTDQTKNIFMGKKQNWAIARGFKKCQQHHHHS